MKKKAQIKKTTKKVANKKLSASTISKIKPLLKSGLTQLQVAKKIKVSRSTVYNYAHKKA